MAWGGFEYSRFLQLRLLGRQRMGIDEMVVLAVDDLQRVRAVEGLPAGRWEV